MGRSEIVILDQEYLSLFTGGDEDLQLHVLNLFIDHAPSYFETLATANNENWSADAHKLKGAARGIGAKRLAVAAERAEKHTTILERQEVLSQLQQALDETINFIRINYLENRVSY